MSTLSFHTPFRRVWLVPPSKRGTVDTPGGHRKSAEDALGIISGTHSGYDLVVMDFDEGVLAIKGLDF